MADLLRKANGILDSSQQVIQNTTLATANLEIGYPARSIEARGQWVHW